MGNKSLKKLLCISLVTCALSGLAGCSNMSSRSIQEEEIIVSDIDGIVTEYDASEQNQETESDFEAEVQNVGMEPKDNEGDHIKTDNVENINADKFGNPKEVLDNMALTSNVEVKKQEEDELQIEFELENVGLCTFAASKGEEFVLPDEVFVDSTKIEWTASTANGESIFPYMRVNETGNLFMIDWAYNGYCFAIYGNSPQNTSDRDMAGKIALAIIYNLDETE